MGTLRLEDKVRLFVDMDGTLSVFTPVDELEALYQKGFFGDAAPHENVVEAVRRIVDNQPDIVVFILSAYLTDSEYALSEKNAWLDKYLPNIDAEHRIFVPCGSDKKEFVLDGVRDNDYLLDDYTINLNDWQPPAKGIKLLNGINNSRGTWEYDRISYSKDPVQLADDICSVILEETRILDERPLLPKGQAQEAEVNRENTNNDKGGSDDTMAELTQEMRTNAISEYNVVVARQMSTLDSTGDFGSAINMRSPMFTALINDFGEDFSTWQNGGYGLQYAELLQANRLRNDFNNPRMAILQIREDGGIANVPRFASWDELNTLQSSLSSDNYEMVFVEERDGEFPHSEDETQALLRAEYDRFNANTLRPSNYYGHSVSMGDVVVFYDDTLNARSFYVDRFGFQQLPDNFLTLEMNDKIRLGMDVHTELGLMRGVSAFATKYNLDTLWKIVNRNKRFMSIGDNYHDSFSLAAKREVIESMGNKLNAVFDYEMKYGGESNFDSITKYDDTLGMVVFKEDVFMNNSAEELTVLLNKTVERAFVDGLFYERITNIEALSEEDVMVLTGRINIMVDEYVNLAYSLPDGFADPLGTDRIDGIIKNTLLRSKETYIENTVERFSGMRAQELLVYVETMSDIDMANLPHNTAIYVIGLLDAERFYNESVIQDIMNDGYDETYTPERVAELESLMERNRLASIHVSELAIEQYMNGTAQYTPRPEITEITQEQLDRDKINNVAEYDGKEFRGLTISTAESNIRKMSNCRFYDCRFIGFDAQGADFNNSIFTDCHFDNGNLSLANMKNTDIFHCVFRNVDALRTDLSFANIRHTTFVEEVNISGMNLSYAKLDAVNFNIPRVDTPVIGIDTISITMGGATSEEIAQHRQNTLFVLKEREDIAKTDKADADADFIKYYSLNRPVGIGTYPREGFQRFQNYDNRQFVDEIGREAWGELYYNRELSQNELADYELIVGQALDKPTQEDHPHREDIKEGGNDVPRESEATNINQNEAAKTAKDQLQEKLANGIREVMDSEKFKNWLNTGARLFYNQYSFRNAFLVALQKDDATYVMGYEAWKGLGRNVSHGAVGAKILMPVMASEKFKGGLFTSIKRQLNEQLSKDLSLQQAIYQLGQNKLEFTLNRGNGLMGIRVDGKEMGIFKSDDECKRYIDRAILGKVPMYFSVGSVFDIKDTMIPEYLWMKRGFDKAEIVVDENDKPIKNKRGETKIYNTPERQARFQPALSIEAGMEDPDKMTVLFEACVAASERNGVPILLRDDTEDERLQDGALGYYSREISDNYPKGYIVINKNLEITEKCRVAFHEMGHSRLHSNLDDLANQMGEDSITKSMREIQAEAVAYMTGSNFGFETDTGSFNYLAQYTMGFELQEFQKSLEIIYRESQKLLTDLKTELDVRGYNLDLTEKEKAVLNQEAVTETTQKYLEYALDQGSKAMNITNELPELVLAHKDVPKIMDILKEHKKNLDNRNEDAESMIAIVQRFAEAGTRTEQDECVALLEKAQQRIVWGNNAFENLTEMLVVAIEEIKGGLKVDFDKDPKATIQAMCNDYPRLKELSTAQLNYVVKSKFISKEYGKLLRSDVPKFVENVCDRAERIGGYASKSGVFVEINYCEDWLDKPIFEKGTLAHPKIIDDIISQAEAQVRGLKIEAQNKGEYFPYAKCDFNVFSPTSTQKGLSALNTRIEIGDGEQTGLKDHLQDCCNRGKTKKEILENCETSFRERKVKDKIYIPSEHLNKEKEDRDTEKIRGAKDWKIDIDAVKKEQKTGERKDNQERKDVLGR